MRTYQPLSQPRYYRERVGDFLIVTGIWREDGKITRYDGAASLSFGKAPQVIGWEFPRDYLRGRCRRVAAEMVPPEWHRSLDRYIGQVEQTERGV